MREYLLEVAKTLEKVDMEEVEKVFKVLKIAKENQNTVFTFGNGGSAATASHFANDLMKMDGLKAICISDMTPTTLAYGNDEGWENMFAYSLENLLTDGDVLLGFSCSGNSMNVKRAIWGFKNRHFEKILFTGDVIGAIYGHADISILVPHPDIRVQEDVHLAICHLLAGELENV